LWKSGGYAHEDAQSAAAEAAAGVQTRRGTAVIEQMAMEPAGQHRPADPQSRWGPEGVAASMMAANAQFSKKSGSSLQPVKHVEIFSKAAADEGRNVRKGRG